MSPETYAEVLKRDRTGNHAWNMPGIRTDVPNRLRKERKRLLDVRSSVMRRYQINPNCLTAMARPHGRAFPYAMVHRTTGVTAMVTKIETFKTLDDFKKLGRRICDWRGE